MKTDLTPLEQNLYLVLSTLETPELLLIAYMIGEVQHMPKQMPTDHIRAYVFGRLLEYRIPS